MPSVPSTTAISSTLRCPKEVSDVESRFAVYLPKDYVAFLTEIGNGGAGPSYGLHSLQKSITELEQANAFRRGYNLPDAAQQTVPPRRQRCAASDRRAVSGTPLVLRRADRGSGPRDNGNIAQGVCFYDYLVITGEQHGVVWCLDGSSHWKWCPAVLDIARQDFLSWYEAWLDWWLTEGVIDRWIEATGGNRKGSQKSQESCRAVETPRA